MIRSIYVVKAFEPFAALTLIVSTSMMGYLFGCVGAVLWNRMHRQ